MAASFFFYDLETSGIDSKRDRIMQFAGQRTDMDLNPIGEPLNLLVALTDEVLPQPGALLVTGITPQQTKDEGYTEAQFLEIVCREVLTPDTIIIGYNNIKFDDEFMRCTFFRNMYDPYEWQLQQGRSRWDFLDVVRLTRALRPEGIEWPFDASGVQSNRLEHLSAANGLAHEHAHDALSDVYALIGVAKLIRQKQPKLYDYLLKNKDKDAVQKSVSQPGKPFIHTSYVYPKEFLHTTVVSNIAEGRYKGSYYVFDLRYDPTPWINMSAEELRRHCQKPADERTDDHQFIPVRELKCNQCPAVAPYEVLRADPAAQERIGIDLGVVQRHLAILDQHPDFGTRVVEALEREFAKETEVECQLYEGFIPNGDKAKMAAVRAADAKELKGFDPGFSDKRLQQMLVRYKARNYPSSLTDNERAAWETYKTDRLRKAWPQFINDLQQAEKNLTDRTDPAEQYIIEELRLYAEAVIPATDGET
ncbi:MAG TPA: exodeoxyribonuclease I [Candidatus Saccharimonadales bacterium]|nr:exodeoxyribonuclease I [Candidatus Saccharimonadales bacterium]